MFTNKRMYIDGEPCIVVEGLSPYCLADTVDCGQCFCFDRVEGSRYISEYTGISRNKYVHVAQNADGALIFFGTSDEDFENIWVPYFSLDISLNEIRSDILKNAPKGNKLHLAADAAGGIAILRQDAWEALFSFIVSQNNNIPRIRKIIRTVCRLYGQKTEGGEGYALPTPKQIMEAPALLEQARVGFRLRYLLDAARRVCNGDTDLAAIMAMENYEDAKRELMKIVGVGDKVADCVLLYGMNRLCAFPIDVWIKRAMGEYFTDEFTPAHLGRYAGVAQQYIFHYARVLEKEGDAEK